MRSQISWFIVCLTLLSFVSLSHAQVRGDYEALKGVPAKDSMPNVLVEEILNFGCPHCKNLYELSKDIRKKYEGRVTFVDIPITFQGQDDAPIRLYYIAQKAGKASEAKAALFEAKFKHGVNVFDPGIVNYLARTLGLGEQYRNEKSMPWVDAKIAEGQNKVNEYGVRGTPTVIVAESLKMKIGHSLEKFVETFPQTLEDLLK